jgi:phospholipid/cholesterol/gamma-HCH transport system substrate-binding protein
VARTKEFKVGLFVVITTVTLYIGFNYLRGLDVFSPLNTYYVKYQSVAGLNKGAKIILNGLEVGSVVDRRFSSIDYEEVIVTLAIDKTIVLNDSTEAMLNRPDLLGGVEIRLIMHPGGENLLVSGDTLIGGVDKGISELLAEEGLSAANELSSLVKRINDVLEPFAEKKDSIAIAIDNFKTFSEKLNDMTDEAQMTLEQVRLSVDYVSDSLVAAMGGIDPMLKEYTALGEKLNAVDIDSRLVQMDSVLAGTQAFLAKLNSDEGTLAKLMSDDSLYNNINLALADLDSLLVDFRYNPKRYVNVSVFSKKYVPPAEGREKATKKKKK